MMKTLNLKTLDPKTLGKLALTMLLGLGVYSYLQERNAPAQGVAAPTLSNPTPRAGFAPRSSVTPQNAQGGWGNVPNAERPIGGPNTIAPIYRNQGMNGGQGAYPSSAPDAGNSGYGDSLSNPQNGDYGNVGMGNSPMNYDDSSSYAAPTQNYGSSDYGLSQNGNFDPAAGVAPATYSKFNDPAYIHTQEEQHIQERDLLGGTTTYKDDQGNYVQTDGSNGAAYQDPNSGNVATFDNAYDAPPASSNYSQELTPLGDGSSETPAPSTPAPEVPSSAE